MPNLLSVSRIPAALLILAIFRPESPTSAGWSLALLLVIGATDVLDGYFARRHNTASEFGYLVDGLGDRAVHVTAYLILLSAGVLPAILVWALIFREISQYGVRLAEPEWRRTTSPTDRWVTKTYAFVVHGALAAELARTIVGLAPHPSYAAAVQIILGVAALASYSRILPRLSRAWAEAVRG